MPLGSLPPAESVRSSAALSVSRNTSLVLCREPKSKLGHVYKLRQDHVCTNPSPSPSPSAPSLSPSLAFSCWNESRLLVVEAVVVEGVEGLQRRRCVVGVNNKVNSFCRSVQVQSPLTKPKPCRSATLEFHYTAVHV